MKSNSYSTEVKIEKLEFIFLPKIIHEVPLNTELSDIEDRPNVNNNDKEEHINQKELNNKSLSIDSSSIKNNVKSTTKSEAYIKVSDVNKKSNKMQQSENLEFKPEEISINEKFTSEYETIISTKIAKYSYIVEDGLLLDNPIIVIARIKINNNGKLLSAHLDKGTSDSKLDNKIMKMLIESSPYPPFPVYFKEEEAEFILPIRLAE